MLPIPVIQAPQCEVTVPTIYDRDTNTYKSLAYLKGSLHQLLSGHAPYLSRPLFLDLSNPCRSRENWQPKNPSSNS